MAEPVISLVVIARDEAARIAGFLERHRPLYDEAVVIDTGSRDGTARQASAAGARVSQHLWQDDFAAARNAGLAQARGIWILTLDPDEVVPPADHQNVRRAAGALPDRYYLLPQWNYTGRVRHPEWQPVSGRYPQQERGQAGFVETRIARMFPRRADLRYRGKIHESVEVDADRLGLAGVLLDIPVHHYGQVCEAGRRQRKQDLYGRLVRAKWRQNPADPSAGLEMAVRLLEEGCREQAVALLRRITGMAGQPDVRARARLLLGRALLRAEDPARAELEIRTALRERPGWLFCWLEMVRILVQRSAWTEAQRFLADALRLFGPKPLLLKEECRLLVQTGRIPEAAAAADRLVSLCPGWPTARLLQDKCRQLASLGRGKVQVS